MNIRSFPSKLSTNSALLRGLAGLMLLTISFGFVWSNGTLDLFYRLFICHCTSPFNVL